MNPSTVTLTTGAAAPWSPSAAPALARPSISFPRATTGGFWTTARTRAPAGGSLQFDDLAGDSGIAPELGYGDGDEATEVGFVGGNNNKNATTYFRTTFNVADPASVSALSLRLTYDDGAIAYLNGTEVAVTSNMDSGAAFDDYSNGDSPGDNAVATFNAPAEPARRGRQRAQGRDPPGRRRQLRHFDGC
ncbi:MAG: hypothetical protein R3F11_23585 [Verrucomicrobiales bacterium]